MRHDKRIDLGVEDRARPSEPLPREVRPSRNHPTNQILGNPLVGVRTRRGIRDEMNHSAFISILEPTNVEEALGDESWVEAMHEELNQFKRNDVWDLVPRPKNQNIIGTKWVFKNKSNDRS